MCGIKHRPYDAYVCVSLFADHADSSEILYINEMIMALKLMRKAPTHTHSYLKPHSQRIHTMPVLSCSFAGSVSIRFDRIGETEKSYTQRERREREKEQQRKKQPEIFMNVNKK